MKKDMTKIIKIIIVPVIIIISVIFISYTKNTNRYASAGSSGAVYIHDKYEEVDSMGNISYFLNISYSVFEKTYNHTLKLNDDFEEISKSLLYDSLFIDKEYAAVGFIINIPTDIAKEAGVLGIDKNGKDTGIDMASFFNKENAFIEQWLEINYVQAELY